MTDVYKRVDACVCCIGRTSKVTTKRALASLGFDIHTTVLSPVLSLSLSNTKLHACTKEPQLLPSFVACKCELRRCQSKATYVHVLPLLSVRAPSSSSGLATASSTAHSKCMRHAFICVIIIVTADSW